MPTSTGPASDSPNRPIGFAADVRGLFRARDRSSMTKAFDLWSHEDVVTHQDAIVARLRDGSMPCDGSWPAEQVATFERWMEQGSQP